MWYTKTKPIAELINTVLGLSTEYFTGLVSDRAIFRFLLVPIQIQFHITIIINGRFSFSAYLIAS